MGKGTVKEQSEGFLIDLKEIMYHDSYYVFQRTNLDYNRNLYRSRICKLLEIMAAVFIKFPRWFKINPNSAMKYDGANKIYFEIK